MLLELFDRQEVWNTKFEVGGSVVEVGALLGQPADMAMARTPVLQRAGSQAKVVVPVVPGAVGAGTAGTVVAGPDSDRQDRSVVAGVDVGTVLGPEAADGRCDVVDVSTELVAAPAVDQEAGGRVEKVVEVVEALQLVQALDCALECGPAVAHDHQSGLAAELGPTSGQAVELDQPEASDPVGTVVQVGWPLTWAESGPGTA